ncbi:LysR family transcriptional regulator [Variovorax sp. LG9.2]|uniref:LysR family transcriptional regulator n=1 Tax=Variovorax sp. LG9.2 TaxID=3048626 RepID=UPI002B23571C|nr:LysR family transcriptional regulator [Variovorax sp. LG9.2]
MTAMASPCDEAIGLDLHELETFIAVARLGSFSLAAQQLHVTQPSVTGRVQRLEASLGTPLLIRTTRAVRPTPAGAALLTEASSALEGLRKLVSGFRQDARLARQRVVVASTPMLAALTLPSIIRGYGQRFTDVQVVLRDLRYPEALAALESGAADIAVLAYEEDDKRFSAQTIGRAEMVVVAPSSHPLATLTSVTVAQLAAHPLLLVEQYLPMRERIVEALKPSGLTLAPYTLVDNLNTLLGMLDAELGATLLPVTMAARKRMEQHTKVEIEDLKLFRTFSVVRSSRAQLGTAAESFSEFVIQSMR